jgi:hypothetical protein
LTTVSTPKDRDISTFGLSEGAVTAWATSKIDAQMLNRHMKHRTFPYLLHLIKSYFDNSIAAGVVVRNAIIDMTTAAMLGMIGQTTALDGGEYGVVQAVGGMGISREIEI